MNYVTSLVYPENTLIQCPYSLAELQKAADFAPDSSYPILSLDPKKFFNPIPQEKQIERGTAYRVIDVIGNILAIPEKILLLNSQYHSNYISPETEEIVRQYLQDNKLHHVKVRLNQYNPLDDLERHFTNPRTSLLTKILSSPIAIIMAAIPTRLYGSDRYDQFSDTIHIVSNDPAIALHEAGHAKDTAS